jgi:hypothetical protein
MHYGGTMKRFTLILMLVISCLCFAEVRILEQSPTHLQIIIENSDYQINHGNGFSSVEMPDWQLNDDPGAPALPWRTFPIAIPPQGSVTTRLLQIERQQFTLPSPYLPGPTIVPDAKTQRFHFTINPQKYAVAPTAFFSQDAASRYRFLEFVPITVHPVQYDHQSQSVIIATRLVLDITIEGNTDFRSTVATTDFDAANNAFFTNYNAARNWKTLPQKPQTLLPFARSDYWYKITVDEPGIYQLDAADLQQLPRFTDPAMLRLFSVRPTTDGTLERVEVPLDVPATSRLDTSSSIRFEHRIATGSPHYYWLTYGGDFATPAAHTSLQTAKAIAPLAFQRKIINAQQQRDEIQSIIVYPAEFLPQAQELATIHQQHYGINSILADQQDMFDAYSGGLARPESIQDSLQAALIAHPELQSVILLGSGTEDWSLAIDKNRIMVYDFYDDSFVDFNENVSPELIIGRLPAQNTSQLELMLSHIRQYIEEPDPGYWRNTLLFTADDEYKSGHFEGISSSGTTNGLNHTQLSEETAQLIDPGVYIRRIYGLEYGFDEFNNKPDARNDIIQQINDGTLIWYFIGHGNEDVLGDEEYFRGSLHLPLLTNENRLNLFIAASCSVGQFYDPGFDSMAEKIVMLENGGSIVSIAASWNCGGYNNTLLMKNFLTNLINDRQTVGQAMLEAKLINQPPTNFIWNSRLYHIFGDPLLQIHPPQNVGGFTALPDSLQRRQLVDFSGEMGGVPYSGTTAIRAYDSIYDIDYVNILPSDTSQVFTAHYTKPGNRYFFGSTTTANGTFAGQFIVPDDARSGDFGKLDAYVWDASSQKDYLVSQDEIRMSPTATNAQNTTPPEVTLWLETRKFQTGDIVSTSPLVIAAIEDENGINTVGSAGHRILLLLDDSTQPIDATEGFSYDEGSCTQGELSWQLSGLDAGEHRLQLICFDNFNNPTLSEVQFTAVTEKSVSIQNMLPYPNPIKKDGYFTFSVPGDTSDLIDVTVSIYTITGRKIRTIKAPAQEIGYNQIYWDGRDGDGDRPANNTYLYKVKVKRHSDGKRAEKIGKVIILK